VWACGLVFTGFAIALTVHAIAGDKYGRFWPHHEKKAAKDIHTNWW
jgi:hypothetical protein